MGKRIFMDVPQVLDIANNLASYSETQTKMVEKYSISIKRMINDMEGTSKESLEKATTDIQKESMDAIGRMTGFSFIYKVTGNNRLLLDKEGAESAQIEKQGLGISVLETSERTGSVKCFNMYTPWMSPLGQADPKALQQLDRSGLVLLMKQLADDNKMDQDEIDEHKRDNVDAIALVYESGQYIENQDYWSGVKYGDHAMSYDGCGIIAIVNAYHSMGVDLTDEEVAELIAEFEEYGIVCNGDYGTSPLAIVEYYAKNPFYEVRYTTTTDPEDLKVIDDRSDTFIVEIYNEGSDIFSGLHYVNIEKRVDENGDVKYIVHNAGAYNDEDGDGDVNEEEYIEYDSLELAIQAAGNNDDSQYVMVIGITKPIYSDAPEKEESTC